MYVHNFFKLILNYLSAASLTELFVASLPTFKVRCHTHPHLSKRMKDMAATCCKGKIDNAENP
jgi:hypothetical protein